MFQMFNFETQINFEEEEMVIEPFEKVQSNPTTAFNSPGSVKSQSESFRAGSERYQCSLRPELDNSFEMGTQVNHAETIFNASTELFNESMDEATSSQTGFNNDDIYRYSSYCFQADPKNIDEAIKSNRMLRYCQKASFLEELQKESELSNLLVELMVLFNKKVFGEIIFIVHSIWNKRYLNYRESKKAQVNIIPKFSCFFGFDGEMEHEDNSIDYSNSDVSDIKAQAEKDISALAEEIFNSKKLKYFNFKEIKGEKQNIYAIRQKFQSFVKVVSRSVFLSAEGVYCEESEVAEEVSIPSFSEQDQDVCSNDCFENNRFVRAHSQIQQADGEFLIQSGSKRVKRF